MFSDKKSQLAIKTYEDLKKAVSFSSTVDELLDYHQLVDSIEKLKELFFINFDFAKKLLKNQEIRNLFKETADIQKILSASVPKQGSVDPFDLLASFTSFYTTPGNLELKILLNSLIYDELVALVNDDFLIKNAAILITSFDDLDMIFKNNPMIAITLAQTNAVAKLLDFDHFYHYATSKSSLLQAFVMAFSKSPHVENLPWSEALFVSIAAVNPAIAYELLKHPKIADVAKNVKNQIGFENLKYNFPIILERESKRSDIAGLDLAKLSYQSQVAKHDDLSLQAEKNYQKAGKIIANKFMTTQSYFDQMMFGGKSGYYSSGRVDFKKDFVTFASMPRTEKPLAGAFAYQLLMCRKKMIAEGKLDEKAPFNVLEGGAGNGNLCFNILTIIKQMAESTDPRVDEEWKGLHDTISYHIVERSPELVKIQTAKNEDFIGTKLQIVNADAKCLAKALPHKNMSAVISNELLDVFPPQQLTMNKKGRVDVGMILPTLEKNQFNKFKHLLTDDEFKTKAVELDEKSKQNTKLLTVIFPNFKPDKNVLYLSEQDFFKLHEMAIDKRELASVFSFIPFPLDSDYFPKVKEFVENNKEYLAKMRPGDSELLNLGIDDFIKNVTEVLLIDGEIISVDYGNSAYLTDKRLRTYRDSQVNFDIFKLPGYEDMTYDINFTDMVKRSQEYGVELLYFGNQDNMLPKDLYFPEEVISKESREYFSTNKNMDTFKACIQYKASSPAPQLDLKTSSAERYASAAQLVTYSDLFYNYKKGLVEIKQQFSNQISRITALNDFKVGQRDNAVIVVHHDVDSIEKLYDHLIKNEIAVQWNRDSQQLIIPITDIDKICKMNPINPIVMFKK